MVCLNGPCISEAFAKSIRVRHIGKRQAAGAGASYSLSVETQAKELDARLSALKDAFRAATATETVTAVLGAFQAAQEGPQILRPIPAMAALGELLGLSKVESEAAAESLVRWGDFSRYGALNAITETAHNAERVAGLTYDRGVELETLASTLLTFTSRQWEKVAVAVAEENGAPKRRQAA
jgi:hypothetical protein